MDKEKMAEVIGRDFGAVFPDVAAQEAEKAKKSGAEKPEQEETEAPQEETPASEEQASEEQASEQEATEAAAGEDEKQKPDTSEETEGEEDQFPKGRRAEKRIKQLLAKNKEQEALVQQYAQTVAQMQDRLKSVEEQQKSSKPKGWEDLSVTELKAIKNHPNATEDQKALAEQNMETALLREAEERATKAAQKVVQEQLGQASARQRQSEVVNELYSKYPDITKEDSPLRQAAKEVWEQGIPEYGITAADLQNKPEGLRIAVDHAFNTRFSSEERKAMSNKVKTLQNRVNKQQTRAQLEGNGRPSSVTPKRSPSDSVKDYRSGKIPLTKLLDERIGHLIQVPQD